MKKLLLTFLVLLFTVPKLYAAAKAPQGHAVAVAATPVLNTPDFKGTFSGKVKLDPCQGVRPVEFVALPGTLFTIEGELEKGGIKVYRVSTKEYPYHRKTGLFVDARFVELVSGAVSERSRSLPALPEVQKRLLSALGRPYVWGGNLKDGVPLLKNLYPQGDPLAGVDCTGLLYEATDGFTPRNSSALTSYGQGVAVAGLSAHDIASKLKPLDLVVWNGHVMMVLDQDSIIESRMGCGGGKSGVMMNPIEEVLAGVMKTRKPVDVYPAGSAGQKSFVVRRWFPADGADSGN